MDSASMVKSLSLSSALVLKNWIAYGGGFGNMRAQVEHRHGLAASVVLQLFQFLFI